MNNRDLAKAKVLLLLYSGWVFNNVDDVWVMYHPAKSYYKKYIIDELVKEEKVEYKDGKYFVPDHYRYLVDTEMLKEL